MGSLIGGYRFYKSVQGASFNKEDLETKNKLSEFRQKLGEFTDKLFLKYDFVTVPYGKGNWQNGGFITQSLQNRYKPKNDNGTLALCFYASPKDGGIFVSIGLNDDNLDDFEQENRTKIYEFLDEGCEKIDYIGFTRKGERVFFVEDESNFESLDYSDLIKKLIKLYEETYQIFYVAKSILALYLKEHSLEYMIITDDEKPIFEYKMIQKECCQKLKYKKIIAQLLQKYHFTKTLLCVENSFSKTQIDTMIEKLSKKDIAFDEVFKDTSFIYNLLKEMNEEKIKELDFSLENIPNGWVNLGVNEKIVLHSIVKYLLKKMQQ